MVQITGIGMITALGNTVAENLQAILEEKEVLGHPNILQTRHRNEMVVGEVKQTNEQLAAALNLPGAGFSRTTLLGLHALRETLKTLPPEQRAPKKIAFINATTVGGMSDVENLYSDMISPATEGDFLSYIDSLDCADCTQRMADYFDLRGFQTTISTACSSSANALQLGARMIESGEADIAICGGADALTRFTLNGFNALKNVDKKPTRPFDQHRNGLNLGEGAAYLILESETSAKERDAAAIAVLAGYGNTNEAHHPTAPSPDGAGALLTMQEALSVAGLDKEAIDYINAHGTATLGNDLSEGTAIERLFGNQDYPHFSSTKAFTGHTLAASGAVGAIICCLAIRGSFIPPNLRFETPMEEIGIVPQKKLLRNTPVRYALANSFGFGGNNVSLVLGDVNLRS
ncbi:beta-ketoacyl-[acyl-carrier-protein] synthase family protein [Taibaiella helva]|uniref:beta-ketoacyl-[acyl-carrier-protein] synthase family protein n=1 Tax=Taibaiella helva TaxID=2301235 RepID=UPI000E5847A0|nr:beta-ketoacyl-[acyl-carrier-protein] synthase family protein [Taibaiella helva]